MVLREAGLYSQAIEHLNKHEINIVDKLSVEELKGECYMKLYLCKTAEGIYLNLLDRNPDKLAYYKQLEICKSLSKYFGEVKIIKPVLIFIFLIETVEEKAEFYRNFAIKYPKCDLPRKLPLEFLEGTLLNIKINSL
jgi:hypothetical protein